MYSLLCYFSLLLNNLGLSSIIFALEVNGEDLNKPFQVVIFFSLFSVFLYIHTFSNKTSCAISEIFFSFLFLMSLENNQ